MDSNAKQLVDSLTDHIALYHSTSNSKPSKSQFRNNAVQWMSSLTTEQRQAALTTVDESWLAIVLQMHNRLQTDGPGFFILLTDVLVSQNDHGKDRHGFKPQADDVALPSLCYRKAKGLLARVNTDNEAERILMQSIRLFSSTEGEFLSPECTRLDSLTVAEDLVKDADRFLAVMDAISNCDFLRSAESPPSACKWEELPWLKAKGYYSVAAFVANKLELSLRLSWLHSHGKKRSSRMKSMANSHEVHKNGRDLAGIASNVFWRKKACVDWWSKVNETTRAEAFKLAVAKVAKFEVFHSNLSKFKLPFANVAKYELFKLDVAMVVNLRNIIPFLSKFKLAVAKVAKFELFNFNSSEFKLAVSKVAKFDVFYQNSALLMLYFQRKLEK